jgi:hypothetical protein
VKARGAGLRIRTVRTRARLARAESRRRLAVTVRRAGPYVLATSATAAAVIGGFVTLGPWGWFVAAGALLIFEWRVQGS